VRFGEVPKRLHVEGAAAHLRGSAGEAVVAGELSVVEEMPHVVEGLVQGQIHGVEAAVDETPGLSVDVGQLGLGDRDVLEPAAGAGNPRIDLADLGRFDELAERYDPDELVVVDDRDMAEMPLDHLVQRVGDVAVRRHGHRRGRHPLIDLRIRGMSAVGRCFDEVALGEDAHDRAVVGDHHRTHFAFAHRGGRVGQGRPRRRREGIGCHDFAESKLHPYPSSPESLTEALLQESSGWPAGSETRNGLGPAESFGSV
jgi:hypothetical protein